MFAHRSLVYLVEEGMRCVMNLEDVDSLLSSMPPQRFEDPMRAYERARLQQQRQLLVALPHHQQHLARNSTHSFAVASRGCPILRSRGWPSPWTSTSLTPPGGLRSRPFIS